MEEFRGTYVAGFDIAADKPGNAIDAHIPAFRYARDRGIPFKAHAGERRGPVIVWDTQDFLQCNTNALNAAFVPDEVRKRLLAQLADGYQRVL